MSFALGLVRDAALQRSKWVDVNVLTAWAVNPGDVVRAKLVEPRKELDGHGGCTNKSIIKKESVFLAKRQVFTSGKRGI